MKTLKSKLPQISLKYDKGTFQREKISSSRESFDLLQRLFNSDTIDLCEQFMVLLINRANNTIGYFNLSTGGVSATVADPKLIYATALTTGASAMIIAHNHPSGNLKASKEDIDLTRRLKEAGNMLDIQVLDHIILADGRYLSFSDEGLL
jgi:DNA repair protein RadC